MKPKFTCGALNRTTVFADVPLAATTWEPSGAARRRTGIGVDSCHEQQEKNEKTREGQRKETAATEKAGEVDYPFAAEEGIVGKKPVRSDPSPGHPREVVSPFRPVRRPGTGHPSPRGGGDTLMDNNYSSGCNRMSYIER